MAQNPLLQDLVKVPVNLKILLYLWRKDSAALKGAGAASLADLYHLLTTKLLERLPRDSDLNSRKAEQLPKNLESMALTLLRDGRVNTSEDQF